MSFMSNNLIRIGLIGCLACSNQRDNCTSPFLEDEEAVVSETVLELFENGLLTIEDVQLDPPIEKLFSPGGFPIVEGPQFRTFTWPLLEEYLAESKSKVKLVVPDQVEYGYVVSLLRGFYSASNILDITVWDEEDPSSAIWIPGNQYFTSTPFYENTGDSVEVRVRASGDGYIYQIHQGNQSVEFNSILGLTEFIEKNVESSTMIKVYPENILPFVVAREVSVSLAILGYNRLILE